MEVARLACAPDDTMNAILMYQPEDLYAVIRCGCFGGRYYTEEVNYTVISI